MHLNSFQNIALIVMLGVLALIAIPALRHSLARMGRAFAFNTALLANDGALTVGEHVGGRVTGYLDSAPLTTRFLLVKQALTGDNHYTVVTSIADIPLAVCIDEPAASTDPVTFQLINSAGKTQRMVAAGAIPAGSIVVTNGDGYVKALPAVAGVYWGLGMAITTAAVLGDLVEVDPLRSQVGVSFVT